MGQPSNGKSFQDTRNQIRGGASGPHRGIEYSGKVCTFLLLTLLLERADRGTRSALSTPTPNLVHALSRFLAHDLKEREPA